MLATLTGSDGGRRSEPVPSGTLASRTSCPYEFIRGQDSGQENRPRAPPLRHSPIVRRRAINLAQRIRSQFLWQPLS